MTAPIKAPISPPPNGPQPLPPQLSIPFNFIGYTYQELLQSFVDMGYMRNVLQVRSQPLPRPLPKPISNGYMHNVLQVRSQ